jgi:hypothetical protein
MIFEGGMVAIACLALTILHPGVCFQGDWRAANFKFGKQKQSLNGDGKRISRSDSDSDEEMGGRLEPPQYTESIVDDGVSIGEASVATARRVTPVGPGQVHVEMLPVYGIRYESTRDDLPRPSM